MMHFTISQIPNLTPFVNNVHFRTLLFKDKWVLVNGISKSLSEYHFKANNVLEIKPENKTIVTSWSLENQNIFLIHTEDEVLRVKTFFKDEDMLVLHVINSENIILFINKNSYDSSLSKLENIQVFLKQKYLKKVTDLISNHQFYYIENFKEFGPVTASELKRKANQGLINSDCFVRDINESNYNMRLRVRDLILEL